MKRNTTLEAPPKPLTLPNGAQWLAGEGAGSWFHIEARKAGYEITRYSPLGSIECSGNFRIISGDAIDFKQAYKFVHLSHCQKVAIEQFGKVITLLNC